MHNWWNNFWMLHQILFPSKWMNSLDNNRVGGLMCQCHHHCVCDCSSRHEEGKIFIHSNMNIKICYFSRLAWKGNKEKRAETAKYFCEVAPRSYETKERNWKCCKFTVSCFHCKFSSQIQIVHKTSPEVSSHSIQAELMHRGLVYYSIYFRLKINLK